MDYSTIADTLAARFASTAVTPPAGYKNITTSTANPGNNIPNTPYVIVWPTEGDLTLTGGTVDGEHTFLVTLYYSKSEGDIPRETKALQKWLGVLIGQLWGAVKLGSMAGVMKSIPLKWEIGTSVYAGDTYESITLTVHVWTEEAVVLVP